MQSFTMAQLLEIRKEVQDEIDRRMIEEFLPKAEGFKEKTLEVLQYKGKIQAVFFLRDELGKVEGSLSACKAVVEKWASKE